MQSAKYGRLLLPNTRGQLVNEQRDMLKKVLYGTEGTSLLPFVKPAFLAVVGCSGMGPCEGHMSGLPLPG